MDTILMAASTVAFIAMLWFLIVAVFSSNRRRKSLKRAFASFVLNIGFLIAAVAISDPPISDGAPDPMRESAPTSEARPTTDIEVSAEEEKQAAEAACRSDLQCWSDKQSLAADGPCRRAIERLAKYDFEWTTGLLTPRFSKIAWANEKRGSIVYFGDQIKFQNGFGAMQTHTYSCTWDPDTKMVLDVSARPGRM